MGNMPADQQTDGQTDRRTNGRTGGQADKDTIFKDLNLKHSCPVIQNVNYFRSSLFALT